jgi:ribose-phosphate pyrophosphokinase
MRGERLRVFTGTAHPRLAQDICAFMGVPLGAASLARFPDGELNLKIEVDVRGADVFVVQPTCPNVHENLFELLSFADCLRRASADRITAVIPYYGYARKDRKDEGRVPITAKLVANLLERAGADRVVSVDLHAAQVQGFFDIPVDHLHATPVIEKWFQSLRVHGERAFVSPDVGNVKRAQVYAQRLGGEISIIDKRRSSASQTKAAHIIGDVEGKNIFMVDDMITTAGTMTEAVRILRDNGAKDIYIGATHGVFAPPAMERLAACQFTKLAVTDTIPIGNRCDSIKDRLEVLSIAPLLAEAIHRIHHNESVSALFEKHDGNKGRALSE